MTSVPSSHGVPVPLDPDAGIDPFDLLDATHTRLRVEAAAAEKWQFTHRQLAFLACTIIESYMHDTGSGETPAEVLFDWRQGRAVVGLIDREGLLYACCERVPSTTTAISTRFKGLSEADMHALFPSD